MGKLFIRIYDFFEKRRPLLFILFSSILLALAYFSLQVKFEEDISKILPKDKKIEKLNQVFQNSKFMDKLVVMVSLKDSMATAPDSLVTYADELVTAVKEKLKPYINKVNDKVDDELALELFGTISEHLPIYLDDRDYKAIDTLIAPEKIKSTLEQNLRTLTSPAGFALKQMISNDPVGISYQGPAQPFAFHHSCLSAQ
jgi:predicted RND superfamily exporter protein